MNASKAELVSQMHGLAKQCVEQDWDGNGASAVSAAAVVLTERFLLALPDYLPLPELAAESDGSISLDWIRSHNRLLSLSVSTSGRLAYAWIEGADKGHAVVMFDGKNVPAELVERIKAQSS